MPINVYTPSSDIIIKNTEVDFNCHLISSDVRITQYDDSLTILAIALYKDGVPYTLPVSLSAKLLMYRSDRISISEIALGCDANRQVLYFAITREMSKLYGNVTPVIKLSNAANQVAASASFQMTIERNPIQDDGEVVDPSGNHIWPDSDKVVSVSGSTFASLVGTTTNIGYYTINDSSSVTYLSGDDYYLDSNGVAHLITEVQSLTWSALKALCDSSLLTPGKSYRITDYVCTTVQERTHSAGHPFDIIVVADTVNKLNENARAVQHEGDTYFANSKLEAWQVWYSLDNDTSRFAWADTANGKGVIYRLIDEFNNDCPYDFKNIQFTRKLANGELDLVRGVDTWVYTFTLTDLANTSVVDISLKQNTEYLDDGHQYHNCSFNTIKEAILDSDPDSLIRLKLNDNVFLNIFDPEFALSYYGCYSNNFGNGCYSNTFGNGCYSNSFGNDCNSNTFGNDCYSNSFGNECDYNTFGNDCDYNTFGNGCNSNSFGNECDYNTFGNYCYSNSFGNYCNSNSFGNYCYSNSFGNDCYSNTFGNYCSYLVMNDCNSSTFGNDCSYLVMSDLSATPKRYISVENGLKGASDINKFDLYDLAILDKDYQVAFKKSASGKYLMLWATDTGTMTGKVKATSTTPTWSDIV